MKCLTAIPAANGIAVFLWTKFSLYFSVNKWLTLPLITVYVYLTKQIGKSFLQI